MHTRSILSVCGLVVALTKLPTVSAVPKYAKLIPNGNGVAGVTAVGHTDPDAGGALNAFGKAFAAAGNAWTEALCKADSDGDGQTNGEELGDPCCTWQSGSAPAVANGAKDPGSASSKLDDAALASAHALCKSASASGEAPGTIKPADGASNATPMVTPGAPASSSAAPRASSAAPSSAPPRATATPKPTNDAAPVDDGASSSGSGGNDIDEVKETETSTPVPTPSSLSPVPSSAPNVSKNATSSASPHAKQRSLAQVVAAAVVGFMALTL